MRPQEYFAAIDQAYAQLSGSALEERLCSLLSRCAGEFGTSDLFYGSMLNELGGFYRGQRRYPDAEGCFLEALSLFTDRLGPEHPDRATTLNNLAGTHRLMGKWDEAQREFEACLRLYGESVGTEHILYASCLNNLSLLCMDRQEYDRAGQYLAEASDILSKLPPCLDEYATSLSNLANIHYFAKRFDDAEQALKKAIELYETQLGTRTPHYHASLQTLGLVLFKKQDSKGAEQAFAKAYDAALALYGPDHPETKQLLEGLRQLRAILEDKP